jgi:hypothetical protein
MDEQISALNERVDDFRAAGYKVREKIVRDFLGSFKKALPRGAKFDEVIVRTVSALSATLISSHTFLAYSPSPLWQDQTGSKKIRSPNPMSDG